MHIYTLWLAARAGSDHPSVVDTTNASIMHCEFSRWQLLPTPTKTLTAPWSANKPAYFYTKKQPFEFSQDCFFILNYSLESEMAMIRTMIPTMIANQAIQAG